MKGRAMKDSLKKGLIIGAAGSAICVLWHHLLTKKMMQLAMDRVAPQDRSNGKMRVSGSPEMIETTEIVKKAAGQLEKSGCDVVEITAHDGISLIGHWCPCEEPKRTIVAMHGWRSSWSHDFGLIADFWRNNHCSVLYAEQRGQNNSGGDHMSLGLLERYDCLAWTNWINEKTGKSIPIYLAGVSMGATSVLMASELELPDNVFGIAADSAFTSLHAIWKHVSESNLHIPYALHKTGADTLQQIEGNAIYPKVVGAKINLPAMWVLAAITIGGNLAGPIGMLLGVPAAAATYALLKEATDKRETHLKTQEKEQMGNSHKQNIS